MIDTCCDEFFAVCREGTRIFLKILTKTKLQPVNEDCRDDGIAVLACLAHQRDMAVMEVPHGGYQHPAAGVFQCLAQAGDTFMVEAGINRNQESTRINTCVPQQGSCHP